MRGKGRPIEIHGEAYASISEAARCFGVDPTTIRYHMDRGTLDRLIEPFQRPLPPKRGEAHPRTNRATASAPGTAKSPTTQDQASAPEPASEPSQATPPSREALEAALGLRMAQAARKEGHRPTPIYKSKAQEKRR